MTHKIRTGSLDSECITEKPNVAHRKTKGPETRSYVKNVTMAYSKSSLRNNGCFKLFENFRHLCDASLDSTMIVLN